MTSLARRLRRKGTRRPAARAVPAVVVPAGSGDLLVGGPGVAVLAYMLAGGSSQR